jgi:DNA-binding Lrp family transcriptional regulator
MRRLSSREREILAAAYFAADLSAKAVAKLVGCREHVVRRSLHQLNADGLIKLRPYCNPFAIGYNEYVAWLSLHSADRKQRSALCSALCKSSRTTYVTDVEGKFQIFVMFLAETVDEAETFFDSIYSAVPGVFFTKTMGQVRQVTLFTPKRFLKKRAEISSLSYSLVKEVHKLDDMDRKLLSAFATSSRSSRADLARFMGLPESTVNYRIKALTSKGIILTVGYTSVGFDDGVIPFGLIIQTSGGSVQKRRELWEFTRDHPRTSAMLDVVGPWEHQVEVELYNGLEIAEVVQGFYDAFPSYIKRIHIVPIGTMHKLTPYPLKG